jgi:transposase
MQDQPQTIRFTANARFQVLSNGKLRLPKIGDVPVRWSRPLPSEPSSVIVIMDSAGRYFASFVLEATPAALPATGSTVGIDLGLSHFAVLSDGRKIAAPKSSATRLVVPGVRRVAGPGHQRGGQRRQGRRAGGDSLWSAGKTGTRSGAARRSRNPPDLTPGRGVTGGNLRPSGQSGCQ